MVKNLIIFTDLDGTLLNFKTFEFRSILPFIEDLKNKGIKIIPSSSKCFFEIEHIVKDMGLNTPFIVENGAAIYIPKNAIKQMPINAMEEGEYWVLKLGTEREIINKKIRQKDFKDYMRFILFLKNMTKLQQSYYTGLKSDSLDRSLDRKYGEPFIWMGSKDYLDEFKKSLNEEGLSIFSGARLNHLTGLNSKGDAMRELLIHPGFKDIMNADSFEDITTIACGDSENDLSMLEIADYAVVLRLPGKNPLKLKRRSNSFNSIKVAPEGWKETLLEIDLIKKILDR